MFFTRNSLLPTTASVMVIFLAIPFCGCNQTANEELSAETSGLRPGETVVGDKPHSPELSDFAVTNSPSPEELGETVTDRQSEELGETVTDRPSGELGNGEKSYTVPAGGPEELVEFIEELIKMQPRGNTRQAQIDDFGRMMDARIEAAERLMAESDEFFQMAGADAKIESLQVLQSMGHSDVRERLREFYAELVTSSHGKLALMGRMAILIAQAEGKLTQQPNDPESVEREIEQVLVTEPLGSQVFNAVSQIIDMLIGVGANDSASEAIAKVSAAFQNNQDEELVRQAEQLTDRLKQIRFQDVLTAVMEGSEGREQELSEAIIEMFGAPFSKELFAQLFNLGTRLEFSGKISEAEAIYTALLTAAHEFGVGNELQQVQEHLTGPIERVQLLGQDFSIDGVAINGEPFDWSNYAGKIVLVDFWATWCGPCLAEFPKMKMVYERFNADGFEIVGVNLDNSIEAAQSYLSEHSLPWTTVVGSSPDELGLQNPNARKCHVSAIPFLVLIGRDGKVADLHVRGRQLETRVEELISATATTNAVEN